jgi:hypothetical protein
MKMTSSEFEQPPPKRPKAFLFRPLPEVEDCLNEMVEASRWPKTVIVNKVLQAVLPQINLDELHPKKQDLNISLWL